MAPMDKATQITAAAIPAASPITGPGAPAPLAIGQVLRAALWMSGSVLSFSVMAVAGRAAALDLE